MLLHLPGRADPTCEQVISAEIKPYLQAALLQVLQLVLLEVQRDAGATANALALITADGEGATCLGLPYVLQVKTLSVSRSAYICTIGSDLVL
jgi:hypothetical protein